MSLRAYLFPVSLGLAAGWAMGWGVPSPWLPGRAGFAAQSNEKTGPASSRNDPKSPGAAQILTGPAGAARLAPLALFLPEATAAELERLARAFCEAKEEPQGIGIRLILTRWAEVDAAQALAFCQTVEPLAHERAWLVRNALESWARVDPAGALAIVNHESEKSNRMAVMNGISSTDPGLAVEIALAHGKAWFAVGKDWEWQDIVGQIAGKAPEKAAELVLAFKLGDSVEALTESWALQDPAAAFRWLRKLPPGFTSPWPDMEDLLARASRQHPARMEAAIESLPKDGFRRLLLAQLERAKALADPRAAMEQALALPPSYDRLAKLNAVLGAARAKDDHALSLRIGEELGWRFPEALQYESQTRNANIAWQEALQDLAKTDPARALTSAWKMGDYDKSTAKSIVESWSRQDPEAAFRAVMAAPPDHLEAAGRIVAREWAKQNTSAARQAWEGMPPDSPTRMDFLNGLTQGATEHDPAGSLAWVITLPEADRKVALYGLFTAWPATGRVALKDEFLRRPDLQILPGFAEGLFASIPGNSREVAVELVPLLPPGAEAGRLVSQFSSGWTQEDPTAASTWLDTLAAGPIKDSAIAGLAETLVRHEEKTRAAFVWADTIQDPAKRLATLTQIVDRWKQDAPDEARQAVESSHLTPAEKAKLLP